MRLIDILSPFLGTKGSQKLFAKLHLFALYGMNYGRSGDVDSSGEEQVIELVAKEFGDLPQGVFLDCGANVGEYSRELVKVISPQARIFSFEPSFNTHKQLSANVVAYKNIFPIQKGVGDTNQQFTLYSNAQNSKHSSVFSRDMSHWNEEWNLKQTETIEIVRLSDFLQKESIDHVNFIKIDVEGYEINALKGLDTFLTDQKVDIIQFEFGVAAVDGKYFFKDLFYILSPKYRIYRVLKKGFYPIDVYNEQWEIFITTNYIAVSNAYKLKTSI